MVSNSNSGLQRIIDALNTSSVEYGMKINIKKTKVMRMCETRGKNVKIRIDGSRVEQVQQFTYLGSVITEDCKCREEVKRRIAIGKEAFSKRGEFTKRGDAAGVKEEDNIDLDMEYIIYMLLKHGH